MPDWNMNQKIYRLSRSCSETIRVICNSGSLLFTEHGSLPTDHILYKFIPLRLALTKLEPFLASFWKEDILELLNALGKPHGKQTLLESHTPIFSGFYRVTEF